MKISKPIAGTLIASTLVGGGTVVATQPPQEISVRDHVLAAPVKERGNIKGQAIVDASENISYTRDGIRIQITDIQKIDGGVEVFAKAWKNGKSIGFGADGSVEIERFVIINPPISVPTGQKTTKTKPHPIIEGERIVSVEDVFVVNPREALLATLLDIIKTKKQTFGPENIIVNKVGNTTTTVYANPDGSGVFSEGNPGRSWASLLAQTGTSGQNANATGLDTYTIAATTANQWRYLGQGHFGFDTSAITDTDTIDSATFSIYGSTTNGGKVDNNSHSVSVVESTYSAPIGSNDYEAIGSTKFASDMTITAWTDSAYNDFALNASGLANISKTGTDKFALALEADVSATAPSWTSGNAAGVDTTYSEQTGTTQDPKLVIEHTAAVAPTDYSKYGNTFIFD